MLAISSALMETGFKWTVGLHSSFPGDALARGRVVANIRYRVGARSSI